MNETGPTCPRCGYDQSGAVAAWERERPPRCPVSGVCSECGLGFLWRDLLNPEYSRLGTFFEHARRHLPGAFLRTWWRSTRPWVFWRFVRLEYRIVLVRVLAFVPLAWLLTYASVFACYMVVATANAAPLAWRGGFRGGFVGNFRWLEHDALLRAVWPLPQPYGFLIGWAVPPGIAAALLAALIVPFTFVLLPATLRRAKVRRAHLARIWLYGWAALPLLFGLPLLARASSSSWNGRAHCSSRAHDRRGGRFGNWIASTRKP